MGTGGGYYYDYQGSAGGGRFKRHFRGAFFNGREIGPPFVSPSVGGAKMEAAWRHTFWPRILEALCPFFSTRSGVFARPAFCNGQGLGLLARSRSGGGILAPARHGESPPSL